MSKAYQYLLSSREALIQAAGSRLSLRRLSKQRRTAKKAFRIPSSPPWGTEIRANEKLRKNFCTHENEKALTPPFFGVFWKDLRAASTARCLRQ